MRDHATTPIPSQPDELLENLREVNKLMPAGQVIGLQVVETSNAEPRHRQFRIVFAKKPAYNGPRMIDCFYSRRDCAIAVSAILEFLRR